VSVGGGGHPQIASATDLADGYLGLLLLSGRALMLFLLLLWFRPALGAFLLDGPFGLLARLFLGLLRR